MTEWALPCIVCGKELRNAVNDAENQPNDGIYARSSGNYGSTVFDPMNGEYLEFNVCDVCLVTAGGQGRVLSGREARPVVTDTFGTVGWEQVDRPPVLWTRDLPGYGNDDVCYVPVRDLDRLPSTIRLLYSVEHIWLWVAELERLQAQKRETNGNGRIDGPIEGMSEPPGG